jgi:hypothetical protein
VSSTRRTVLEERKALLVARAGLDRARLALAIHDVRVMVTPTPNRTQMSRIRPVAAVLVGVVAPLLGLSRFGRWLRIASLAVAAWRIARTWHSAAR